MKIKGKRKHFKSGAVKSFIRHKMGENSYCKKLTGEREGKEEWNTTIEPQAEHTFMLKVYYISLFT